MQVTLPRRPYEPEETMAVDLWAIGKYPEPAASPSERNAGDPWVLQQGHAILRRGFTPFVTAARHRTQAGL
jgi:hypothetical protein